VRMRVPAAAHTGAHALVLGLRDARGGEEVGPKVTLATLNVHAPDRIFVAPQYEFPLGAHFGDHAELLGANMDLVQVRPGGSVKVTLYWLAKAGFEKPYTVFIHILDQDNHIWAQRDIFPQNGTRPTTGWLSGEVVIDEHVLELKPDIPAGTYFLEVGMYDAADPAFPRMPVLGAAGETIGDRVLLPPIATK